MRIGILGGAFDPIHLGHLAAAEAAYSQANLDEIWFMPSYVPPLKSSQPFYTAEKRYAMTETAIADKAYFRMCDLELKRATTSYTIETAEQLQQQYPADSFYWIIGADRINDLMDWKDISSLVTKIGFIGLARPGYPLQMNALSSEIRNKIQLIEMQPHDLSSSMIRAKMKMGESVQAFVPETIIPYL
jgi:nicotinate-nucleotide adenylyltransferase